MTADAIKACRELGFMRGLLTAADIATAHGQREVAQEIYDLAISNKTSALANKVDHACTG